MMCFSSSSCLSILREKNTLSLLIVVLFDEMIDLEDIFVFGVALSHPITSFPATSCHKWQRKRDNNEYNII